jgi:cytoskeleton protein RodZ
MTETTTLGADLRRERERRGLALRSISENTKVSIALLEGLEADDISRWPGGIFRKAFVRAYAQCVGLNGDEVIRRFETQFPPDGGDPADPAELLLAGGRSVVVRQFPSRPIPAASQLPSRTRLLGTAADMTVAVVLAFGCAAAGSRMLWPVLLIACYYAVGVLLTGTSPMVALLSDGLAAPSKPKAPAAEAPAPEIAAAVATVAPVQTPAPAPPVAEVVPPRCASRRGSPRPAAPRHASARLDLPLSSGCRPPSSHS